jgi:CBS domain-containing protein
MTGMFAGASHAVLTSVVFAFETTRQPAGLLPLLAGGSCAYLVSLLLSRHSIMTTKLARRGATIRTEYTVDVLSAIRVGDVATREVISLQASQPVDETRQWLVSGTPDSGHQGYPVVDADGRLRGLVTRRQMMTKQPSDVQRVGDLVTSPPVVVFEDTTLREAADLMVRERVGRVPMVERENPQHMIGIISRSDLLAAHARRLAEATEAEEGITVPWRLWRRPAGESGSQERA